MDRRLPVRRLLNDARSYTAELVGAIRRGWNGFFFAPADPTALGLIRVATGLLAFWSLLVLGLDLHDYFGSDGWAEPSAVRAAQRSLTWSFWFLVPDGGLRLAWLVCLAILALYTVGLFSRATAVLAWVIVVSTVRRVPVALYGFDQVISPLTLYLAAMGAGGQAVSLDRFLRRWRQARVAAAAPGLASATPGGVGRRASPAESAAPRPTVSANVSLRLIQLHLVVIYGMAGLGKLQGPSWWNGMALWGTMTAGEFVAFDFTPMARWPLLINLLTHASLALELLYPILIWIRITRPLILLGAAALHLGIAVMSPGLAEFTLAMLAANLAFVPGAWLRRLVADPERPPLRVLFDGACPRCRSTVALVMAADPGGAVESIDLTAVDVRTVHPALTPEACLRAMQVVDGGGRVAAGFAAVRSIGGRLPLFWPFAAVASLPGVASLGRVVYNRIADTRPRDVSCTDQTCGIHSATPRPVPRLLRGHVPNPHNTNACPADSQEVPRP
jgi:predicted DCC family thiol-disulfide oxidoreductase YuxK